MTDIINKRYLKAHREMKAEPDIGLSKNIGLLTPEDVQPYGLFLPDIPSLMPPHGDEKKWTVVKSSTFIACDGTLVDMALQMKTDLASTPRIAKLIFGGPGRETPAACGHDRGYGSPGELYWNIFTHEFVEPDRKWWDEIVFKNGMMLCKTNKIKVHAYYRAVRMFGWAPWGRYRRAAKKNEEGRWHVDLEQ